MTRDRNSLPLGDLNAVGQSRIKPRIDFRSKGNSLALMRQSALAYYEPDALAGVTTFRGVVLRVISNSSPHAKSWMTNIFGLGNKNSEKPIIKNLIIRIPEIHSHLPDPSTYSQNTGPWNKIIDMHPIFDPVDLKASQETISVGDFVFCSFGNLETFDYPVYYGVAKKGAGGIGVFSARNTHSKAKRSQLGVNRPNATLNAEDDFKRRQQEHTSPESFGANGRYPEGIRPDANGRFFATAYRGGQPQGQVELVQVPGRYTNNRPNRFLSLEVYDAFLEMEEAARRSGIRLVINSGFRTNEQQQVLRESFIAYETGETDVWAPPAARPGFSNHQNATALDIDTNGANSRIYKWLANNAGKFGFSNEEGRRVGEPWHWNFVGKNSELAKLEERMPLQEKISRLTKA